MTAISLQHGLPFVSVMLTYQNEQFELAPVLLDTGSASTILQSDALLEYGISYESDDLVRRIRGVGGTEFVFTKKIDRIAVGDLVLQNFEIEVGAMDYGVEMKGIIGTDFLTQTGAWINMNDLTLGQAINNYK